MKYDTLITDFDNTLYDWFDVWHRSFSALLQSLKAMTGVEERNLISEIREIHQKYGTSEYAYLLREIPALNAVEPAEAKERIIATAVRAYQSARGESLRLYTGVAGALSILKARGVTVIVYTESLGIYTNYRIRTLGLDGLVDFVYSPPDHEISLGEEADLGNLLPTNMGGLHHTQHRYLPDGVLKPNPEVLLDIIREAGRAPNSCVYIGDSLTKDIAMAQDAGVTDVFAKYGLVQHRPEYDLLRSVSHWPEVAVQEERNMTLRKVVPNNTVANFEQVLAFFGGQHA